LKLAIVYAEITEQERFFEDVAVNRGYRLRVFDDKKKALEWLMPTDDKT
jgi:hypothetical protein